MQSAVLAPIPAEQLTAFPPHMLAQLAELLGKMRDNPSAALEAVPMRLIDYLNNAYLVEHETYESTADYYRGKVGKFSAWLGRDAMLSDLTDDVVNRFMIHRADVVSRETVRGEKSAIVSIWNAAVYAGLVKMPPMRLRKLKRQVNSVAGWSPDDLAKLLDAASKLRGHIRGKKIKRSLFWRAYIMTAYDTGLRCGDLLAMRTDDVTGPGLLVVQQHKTRKPVETALSPQAWLAIRATLQTHRPLLFGVQSRRSFFEAFRVVIKAAGLTGSGKYLRRTSGSMIEAANPGQGHKHLGHSNPAIFERHYRVPELTRRDPLLPPAIADAEVVR